MITHPTHRPTSPEQSRRDALLVTTVLAGLGLFLASRVILGHPLIAATGLLTVAALAGAVTLGLARLRDAIARRADPPTRGVLIGTVRGTWPLARRRPYTIDWDAFRQHVLITGPTGRGKSFGFIEPILRAHIRRPATGVLYMDGKGDRIDQGANPVVFDHVFCPETPEASARWNPLAGTDPISAARSFADALFPAASLPNPVYYEVRGAFAIRAVAPAIAYTGHGVAKPGNASRDDVIAGLVAHGIDTEAAAVLVRNKGIAVCEDQLRWLPTRERRDAEALADFIARKAEPPASAPNELLLRTVATPTVAALHKVLFGDGELAALADALDALPDAKTACIVKERLGLLGAQVRSLANLPAKERAGVLSNLENRLAVFLTPPFDRLCATSTFALADICAGRSVALLLPTGTFPGIAEPLGRVALAQFQQAVLASQPEITKVAVLDEFHNFVSPSFTKFLSQARSRGGAAVMSTQTIADFDIDYRDRLLANASTQIITPGALPFDAEHWSKAFGEHDVEHLTLTTQPRSILDPAPQPSLRRDTRPEPRFTATGVTELDAGQALIRQVSGRVQYPATVVDVERRRG